MTTVNSESPVELPGILLFLATPSRISRSTTGTDHPMLRFIGIPAKNEGLSSCFPSSQWHGDRDTYLTRSHSHFSQEVNISNIMGQHTDVHPQRPNVSHHVTSQVDRVRFVTFVAPPGCVARKPVKSLTPLEFGRVGTQWTVVNSGRSNIVLRGSTSLFLH